MLTVIFFIFVFRGIVISLEDGTLKFVSLSRIANDVPVTGRPLVGMKTQGVSTYQLSEYLIWSVHASEIAGAFHLMSNHSISMSSIGISVIALYQYLVPHM